MARPVRYEAAWAPGLNDTKTADEDDAILAAAFEWLAGAERRFGRPGTVVMYAKRMQGNRPILEWAAQRWAFASTRSRPGWNRGPVVCLWPPDDATLELAEAVAGDTALCVIGGSLDYDVGPWIRRTGATCIIPGRDRPASPSLPREVTERLDAILRNDGHNALVQEKEYTIRNLQEIARMRPRPTRQAIEAYLRESGETHEPGPERAGRWYEEILAGKRHLDYRRRVIGRPLSR